MKLCGFARNVVLLAGVPALELVFCTIQPTLDVLASSWTDSVVFDMWLVTMTYRFAGRCSGLIVVAESWFRTRFGYAAASTSHESNSFVGLVRCKVDHVSIFCSLGVIEDS